MGNERLNDAQLVVFGVANCHYNERTVERVRGDVTEGQSVGVTGTPAFSTNARFLSGAQPFPRFKAIIDDELQRAGAS